MDRRFSLCPHKQNIPSFLGLGYLLAEREPAVLNASIVIQANNKFGQAADEKIPMIVLNIHTKRSYFKVIKVNHAEQTAISRINST